MIRRVSAAIEKRGKPTQPIPAMAPAMVRRIAALSGVQGAIGEADSGAVDLDDIACVARMIRDGAYDILEALNDFAGPGDI